jgi:hypothetical protein
MLGRTVRCPKCQAKFTAQGEQPEEELDEAPEEEEPPRRSRAARDSVQSERPRAGRRPPEEDEEEAEEEESPRARRRAQEEADEEEPEEEEEERPRRRRRRSRRRWRSGAGAEAAVSAPAIALMVTGGLGIAYSLFDIVFRLLVAAGMVANPLMAQGMGGGQNPGFPGGAHDAGFQAGVAVGNTLGITFDVIGIAWGVLILLGAIKMKSLQNHGLALTACILAMVPLNCCCILGLPFGIWGLTVLNREEVKEAF